MCEIAFCLDTFQNYFISKHIKLLFTNLMEIDFFKMTCSIKQPNDL